MIGVTAGGALMFLGIAVVPHAYAVIGGRPVTGAAGSAAVQVLGQQGFCSGSLVDPQWVVTAGHCLALAQNVRAGTLNFNQGGQLVKVDRKVRAPGDLGLLHLAQPVKAPTIQIAAQSPAAGTQATLMGWGQTSNQNNAGPAQQLQALDVTVAPSANCAAAGIDPALELCVGVTPQGSDCSGDSGGPLIVNGLLVGADSRGSSNICGQGGADVYSDVTKSRAFIAGVIGRAASGTPTPTPTRNTPAPTPSSSTPAPAH